MTFAHNRHRILIRHPILRLAQQRIAAPLPLKPPKITLVFRKKILNLYYLAAGKKMLPEHTQNKKYVRWNAPATAPPSYDPASPLPFSLLLMQIAALGGDIQYV